jgi:hypothetical protein
MGKQIQNDIVSVANVGKGDRNSRRCAFEVGAGWIAADGRAAAHTR